jgi:hypothetical protein
MNHLSYIETSVRAATLALLSGGAPLSIDSRMRLPKFSLIEAVRRLLDLIACKISLWRRSVSRFGPRCEFLPFLKIEPSSKDEDTRPALFSLCTDTHLVT